jgi:protein-arginine kinase activator protein McsA
MGHDAPKNEETVKSYSQLQRLEDDLQKAIDAEEYELAAKLRDIISKLKEDQ